MSELTANFPEHPGCFGFFRRNPQNPLRFFSGGLEAATDSGLHPLLWFPDTCGDGELAVEARGGGAVEGVTRDEGALGGGGGVEVEAGAETEGDGGGESAPVSGLPKLAAK